MFIALAVILTITLAIVIMADRAPYGVEDRDGFHEVGGPKGGQS